MYTNGGSGAAIGVIFSLFVSAFGLLLLSDEVAIGATDSKGLTFSLLGVGRDSAANGVLSLGTFRTVLTIIGVVFVNRFSIFEATVWGICVSLDFEAIGSTDSPFVSLWETLPLNEFKVLLKLRVELKQELVLHSFRCRGQWSDWQFRLQ